VPQVIATPLKKRERLDIYADILEFMKHKPEGVLITRISYGAGVPIDRVKPMLDNLTHCDLVSVRAKGDPLQASLVQRRFYNVTKKGLEFLEAYRRIQTLLTYLESGIGGKKSTVPMDYVGATE